MENFSERISELRTILKFMRDIALEYRDKALAASKESDALLKSGEEKSLHIQRLESGLAERSSRVTELEAEKAALATRVEHLAAENGRLAETNASLTSSYASLLAQLSEKYGVVQNFARINDLCVLDGKLRSGINANKEEKERLEKEREQLEAARIDLGADLTRLAGEREDFGRAQREYQESLAELEESRRDIEAREDQLKTARERLEARENEIKARNEELDKKEADLKAKEERLDRREKAVDIRDAELLEKETAWKKLEIAGKTAGEEEAEKRPTETSSGTFEQLTAKTGSRLEETFSAQKTEFPPVQNRPETDESQRIYEEIPDPREDWEDGVDSAQKTPESHPVGEEAAKPQDDIEASPGSAQKAPETPAGSEEQWERVEPGEAIYRPSQKSRAGDVFEDDIPAKGIF